MSCAFYGVSTLFKVMLMSSPKHEFFFIIIWKVGAFYYETQLVSKIYNGQPPLGNSDKLQYTITTISSQDLLSHPSTLVAGLRLSVARIIVLSVQRYINNNVQIGRRKILMHGKTFVVEMVALSMYF